MSNKKKFVVVCMFSIIFIHLTRADSQNSVLSVKIGSQHWMQKNLDVNTFRNGDLIPEAKSAEEWEKAGRLGRPAWCFYENDPKNGALNGKLYNWFAVNDKRGLAPKGWHIPNREEFGILIKSVDFSGNALKSVGHGEGSGAGTNISGFSSSLAGYRYYANNFGSFSSNAFYWSSSENQKEYAYAMGLSGHNDVITVDYYLKEYGLSVRCIKDR